MEVVDLEFEWAPAFFKEKPKAPFILQILLSMIQLQISKILFFSCYRKKDYMFDQKTTS
uniref:Uncharacterized protein n=1 Tax=Arundo donax TaxID=35708 RepID=A0A0A8XW53_ARUDO